MAFTIPTYFTAVDKYSTTVNSMGRATTSFASRVESEVARSERAFRRLTPSIGDAAKSMINLAGTAALIGGAIFSAKSVMDYETAIASFRTIVDDLNDTQFEAYRKQVNLVASDTKRSSIEVAQSFEKIAGLNYKFAETADGLGAVSKAALTLARASGMELGIASENLVGIMNQFSYAATDADKAINILAAGQAVGAANITQTAEAFVNFGSTAAGANITLEESVGLIQTLGKYSLLGADAGTALRGSIIKLQKSGVGYKSGIFSIGDALEETRKKVDSLKTAKEKDALITKIFGIHNITAGRILLNNIAAYKEFTSQVSGTNEAQKQADINSKTLAVTLDNLKNAWINMLTSNENVSSGLNVFKKIISWIADHLPAIITVILTIVGAFTLWWTAIKAVNAVLLITKIISNLIFGINMIKWVASVEGITFVTAAWRSAQWALNAAISANPIGAFILAVVAIGAAIYYVIKYWDQWGASITAILGILGIFFSPIIAGFALIISIIQSFRRNWDMITKAFSEKGILAGLIAIGKTLFDVILYPLQQILSIVAKFTGFEWAENASKSLEKFRGDIGLNVDNGEKPSTAINPKEQQNTMFEKTINNNKKENVVIDFKNVPKGVDIKKGGNYGATSVMPQTSSTMTY